MDSAEPAAGDLVQRADNQPALRQAGIDLRRFQTRGSFSIDRRSVLPVRTGANASAPRDKDNHKLRTAWLHADPATLMIECGSGQSVAIASRFGRWSHSRVRRGQLGPPNGAGTVLRASDASERSMQALELCYILESNYPRVAAALIHERRQNIFLQHWLSGYRRRQVSRYL